MENWWIGSDIPFPWASKWRDDLARGRFPRGLPAQGKGRVPDGIPGFQTVFCLERRLTFQGLGIIFFQSLSLYKPQLLSSVTVLYPLSP